MTLQLRHTTFIIQSLKEIHSGRETGFIDTCPLTLFCIAILNKQAIRPSELLIKPVEKIIYDPNSSSKLKNIKQQANELKWINYLQLPFPLVFNDNIYHEGNISKMPDFYV